MRIKSKLIAGAPFILSILFCTNVFAEQFSADMTSRAEGQSFEAKIAVKDGKCRIEMPQAIMINRADLGVAWVVMPSQGMYMEHPIDSKVMAQTSKNISGEVERIALGKESVNGVLADKFKVTYTDKGDSRSVFQWINAENIPVKVEEVTGLWSVDYHNIKTNGVDDSQFEEPKNYNKIQIPAAPGLNS